MFASDNVFSGFSVDDIDAAARFYGDILGLTVTAGGMGILELHLPSGGRVIVYPKPDHTPASFTILNFGVADVGAAVDELAAKGLHAVIYEGMPQDEKGVMRGNGPDIAWFEDPAGNVFSVIRTE